jgi:protein-disulfide isomerase
VFALSTVGLAFALYLAWASYVVLKVFCILCAVTYVSVIALFIISGGATTFPMITLPRRASRDLRSLFSSPVALVLLLAVFAGSAALIASFPNEQAAAAAQAEPMVTYQPLTAEQRGQLEAWWAVQPIVDLPITGASGTKVLIVKFSDYMCPSCKAAHDAFKPVLAKYEGQGVEFMLKHYPLEGECNINTPGMNHYGSCEAAAAYEMAKGTPNIARLDDWMFRNQTTLTRDLVKKAAAEQAGINDFDARYETALQAVREDVAQGAKLGVSSTPTIFINGRRIPGGGLPPAYYDAIVEMLLKSAK